MQRNWRVGSLFGIPLNLDPSWFYILLLLTWLNASRWDRLYSGWGTATAWGAGFLLALALFASVVLHELGHSLVARAQGIRVQSITLFLFGGIASLDRESRTPGQAFQVAIAGPLVSLGLFLVFAAVGTRLLEDTPPYVITRELSIVNLVLGLFNLVPGLPLDGGQVLKALVWKLTGSPFQGVRWAARSGELLGSLAMGLGVFLFLVTRDPIAGLWLGLLGWFGYSNAQSYRRLTNLQEILLQATARDVMDREFRVLPAEMPLRDFVDLHLLPHDRPPVFFADRDGRYLGLVKPDALQALDRGRWEVETLATLVKPLAEIPTVSEGTVLAQVILTLEEAPAGRVTVLTPAGGVAGLVDWADVLQALAREVVLPAGELQRIKQEGQYNNANQLAALARRVLEMEAAQKGSAPD
ncbi:MAG: site-2 protease family protein [Gloeomargaritaceae cyanobacterium C42_A2020_066]|nr:site-2 protease family protein [Gloeomargaritaceae cyanobacterium C42_A2020_066]